MTCNSAVFYVGRIKDIFHDFQSLIFLTVLNRIGEISFPWISQILIGTPRDGIKPWHVRMTGAFSFRCGCELAACQLTEMNSLKLFNFIEGRRETQIANIGYYSSGNGAESGSIQLSRFHRFHDACWTGENHLIDEFAELWELASVLIKESPIIRA